MEEAKLEGEVVASSAPQEEKKVSDIACWIILSIKGSRSERRTSHWIFQIKSISSSTRTPQILARKDDEPIQQILHWLQKELDYSLYNLVRSIRLWVMRKHPQRHIWRKSVFVYQRCLQRALGRLSTQISLPWWQPGSFPNHEGVRNWQLTSTKQIQTCCRKLV